MKIEEFLTVVNPIDSLFKNQGIYTLKDYLLKKHEEIYRVYIESDANTQTKYQQMKRKNLQSSPNQTSQIKYWKENNGGQDYVEDLSVSMINQETEKRVCFKVKIFVLHMNEPFLIICMEDISIFQENKYLKEKQLNQIDLIQELVKCLEDKMQYIQYTKQYAIRNLQRKIMQFKIILQSFQQNFKLLNVQQFSFSEVIDKIKLIFVDQNIKILGEYSDLLVFSDKKYIFKSIFVIIASLGVENINSIEISQVKDKLSERIILNIHAKNHEQINEQEKSFYLFDLKLYPKINSLCFKYLKNLMKFICLRDKPDITLIGDNQIEIQIEYLTDIRQLSDLKYTQDKLIQSPALSKKQTSVSMLNITKSQYFQTQTNNFIRYTPKQSSLKYKCPIREQESDEFSEYQFRLDSMHSSHLGVKFPSREIGTPKLKDQPIANFVYNFKKINTLQNQRNNII